MSTRIVHNRLETVEHVVLKHVEIFSQVKVGNSFMLNNRFNFRFFSVGILARGTQGSRAKPGVIVGRDGR